MRQDLNEIKKVFDEHGYSINNSICEVMKKFKFKTLCWQCGAEGVKEEGYSFSEIVTLLTMLPLMVLNSVHALYRSTLAQNKLPNFIS